MARYFEDQRQPFPHRDGWGSVSVDASWGALSVSRAASVLHNPIYAGAYVYGRRHAEEEDPEDPGAHPGYIVGFHELQERSSR